ncbi:ribonucleases P/MRP protein subunit POP1 [Drosophila tropicalis]|uniref:ribonucleases P/MRP protein subunit POP1 n=1 Tax=Drosophila tropicalis TaxID=46794 RepID=UPI0035AC01C5
MSTTQKLEFDAQLGGRITLPTHVSTYHYAAGALAEIKDLISEAQQPTGPGRSSKLIFQSLPKHMRRRAMSHHPKRLPRKYRKAHKSQMGKGGNQPVNHKRPSRKYRRRPGNLLNDYIRRQRKHIWLETHIWHAKRFHMVDRWGHRLPYASCDKTYRACYRASAQHCLLQDISYYCCVEIKGQLDKLHQGFARLTSSDCGPRITAKTYVSGRREGTVELFCDGQYPLGALQRASFIWQPLEGTEDEVKQRTLWLWLHPSAADATIEQILKVFKLKSMKQMKVPLEEPDEDQMIEDPKEKGKTTKNKKPLLKTITRAFELQPGYANSTEDLQLIILRQEFNRFRLTGSGAQRVLASSLLPHPQPAQSQPHADYYEAALRLSSPSELLSNLIMGIQVIDPRLQKPKKRTKPVVDSDSDSNSSSAIDLLVSQPKSLPESPLWQKEYRQQLATNLLSPHAYDELRRKHAVVPGAPCSFEDKLQSVPLILIQRPGSQDSQYKRLGYASGWDVIAPAKYGMNLWLTLIMWGARPGGLREMDSVARESGADLHLPDTQTGLKEQHMAELERRTRYFRLPPNKRCNYRKLSVVSPFKPPWQELIRDWTDDRVQPFYVCRQRSQLAALEQRLLHSRQSWSVIDPQALPPSNSLIQIQVQLLRRGHLQDNALICLPNSQDYKHRWRQLKKSDLGPVHCEPLQPDVNERQRKDLRLAHKRKLKRLRARRVREKRRCQETAIRKVYIRPANTEHLVRAQWEEMCRLWLPTDPTETQQSVRRQSSRQVFGYVSKAAFSYTEAKVCAVGYVTINGLRELCLQSKDKPQAKNSSQLLCLVRDANSRDYRWASFKINLNVAVAPPG